MKTVITYGVFDLFHEGHANLLRRAKALGDRLIVGVITEQFAYERGKYTVVDPVEKRLRNVMACPDVDQVIIEDHFGQKVEDIQKYHADIFAIGDDWLGKFDYLEEYCQVVYLPRTPGISSTLLRASAYPTLRLGLIGCGRIVERLLREAEYVRDVQVGCFYHPHPDHSESVMAFRQRHPGIPLVRTPEKLFDQTDAVYVASPHDSHAAYVGAALRAGKHVLCEKPMSFSGAEARALFALAEENGLVLMEALKTAYCPGFQRLIALCRSGVIGTIRDVDAVFTRLTPKNTREWADKDWGGSFTELGSYVMLPAVKLLGPAAGEPAFFSRWEDGVDAYTRAVLTGERGTASLRTGIGVKSLGQLVISGTEGFITVKAPWWKTTEFEIGYEDPGKTRRYSFPFEGDGLRYELADFLYRVRGYPGRESRLLPEESVRMAELYEAFFRYRRGERDGL